MNPLKAPEESVWVGVMTAVLMVLVLVSCGIAMHLTYTENVRLCTAQGGHLEHDGCVIP